MSSGGGSSSAIQALPAGAMNRPQNDLRGFVKTGAVIGSKDNPGVLDATKSSVKQTTKYDPNSGKYVGIAGASPEETAANQASADEINSRSKNARASAASQFVNVGAYGTKTVLGG